jgi:hypothetical protein
VIIESGDQPQEDLAKFSYKTNKQVKNLGILLHIDQPLKYLS